MPAGNSQICIWRLLASLVSRAAPQARRPFLHLSALGNMCTCVCFAHDHPLSLSLFLTLTLSLTAKIQNDLRTEMKGWREHGVCVAGTRWCARSKSRTWRHATKPSERCNDLRSLLVRSCARSKVRNLREGQPTPWRSSVSSKPSLLPVCRIPLVRMLQVCLYSPFF